MRSASFVRELASAGLRADQERLIPQLSIFEAYPGLEPEVDLGTVVYRLFNLDPFEQYVVAALAQLRKPRRIFEIGTYDGGTTLLLARNAPSAEIFTIDLTPEQLAAVDWELGMPAEDVGRRFHDQPEAGRITQLYGDSRTFDFSPWHRTIDLVVVDADHNYESAKADTATALALLAPGGIVIWDDYCDEWPGVVAAIREADVSVFVLRSTDLAIHDSSR
jgi:predicted O-methyltransferase YrrM